ncbi:MAG TPA: TonB family protein [Paraburkholderia sp.]|jgi:protein TonB|nr:TonB family protein [Paraburkholderia sp.]
MASIVGQRAPRPGTHKPLVTSAAIALAVEALLLAGVGGWLIRPHVAVPARTEPMTITLAPSMPAATPAQHVSKPAPQPAQDIAKPMPQPRRVAPAPPAHAAHAAAPKRQMQPQPQPQPRPVAAEPPTPAPDAAPTPSATQTAAATEPASAARSSQTPVPPPPAAGHPDASFDGALRAAIQAALRYPESARMQGTTGRTLVAFVYRDSAVSDIHVVTSSGVGLLDHAAVLAVRDAECPPPPHGMEGKQLAERLWVDFKLDGNG